jgi:hypothetical protein
MKPFFLRLCPALLGALIMALPALRANDAPAAADAEAELREFTELIHDLTRFAGALPKIALINASPEEVARPEFNRALARLRRLGTVQLYAFPDDGSPARPLNILPPDYPGELRQLNIPGEAYLIGLIGARGRRQRARARARLPDHRLQGRASGRDGVTSRRRQGYGAPS